MNLLLDTHVLLWWLADDRRLPARLRQALMDWDDDVVVSAASGYEIALKAHLGKLDIDAEILDDLPRHLQQQGFQTLAVSFDHALKAGALPMHHHDPFDRLLAAQALLKGWPLATTDRIFSGYGVTVVS